MFFKELTFRRYICVFCRGKGSKVIGFLYYFPLHCPVLHYVVLHCVVSLYYALCCVSGWVVSDIRPSRMGIVNTYVHKKHSQDSNDSSRENSTKIEENQELYCRYNMFIVSHLQQLIKLEILLFCLHELLMSIINCVEHCIAHWGYFSKRSEQMLDVLKL